jgi:anaerobic magnesium-protoporphyrin IX monomethyl ester cyclase
MREKTKVMLIDPPGYGGLAIGRILGSFGTNKADQVWPPYDLQAFAGYCEKNGLDFRILDANNTKMNYLQVEKEIRRYSPDWVIYMTCFPNFYMDAKTATAAKKVSRKIKTACMSLSIMSVEEPMKKMQEIKDLDFMPWGEPEITLMKLIKGENPGKIRGLYYRDKNGKAKFTDGVAEIVRNLDELGIPVHSALPFKIYKCPLSIRLPMTIVNCSRGCVNACVHCQAGNFHGMLRYRSVDSVLKELDRVKKLGIKEIKFYDCALPADHKFMKELCIKMIERKYNFTWNCNARAENITEDILGLMKKAGCHTIAIGCESFDAEILRRMKKNETPEELERAVRLVKKSGMRVLMYMVFGLEGETEESMMKNYRFARKMKPEFVTFGIVVPAPGTPFHRMVKEKGYLIDKKLELQDANFLPTYSFPNLTPEKIHEFARWAYRTYYLRPSYVLMRLRKLRTLTELKMNITNGISVIKRYYLEEIR